MKQKINVSFFVGRDDNYLLYCSLCNSFHEYRLLYWGKNPVGAIKCPYCQRWSKAVECTEQDGGGYEAVISLERFRDTSVKIAYFDKIAYPDNMNRV